MLDRLKRAFAAGREAVAQAEVGDLGADDASAHPTQSPSPLTPVQANLALGTAQPLPEAATEPSAPTAAETPALSPASPSRAIPIPTAVAAKLAPEPEPKLALIALDPMGPSAPDIRAAHLTACAKARLEPLFILGKDTPSPLFLDHSILCEYLPSHEEIFRMTQERADVITLYRLRRLQLMLDKWRVKDALWLGPEAGDLAAKLTESKDRTKRMVRFREQSAKGS